ncbi:PucR family transcriptional regulator ligand-binding domain-containing protein [Clostridium sp.]|uniref:PucR family transcriptional regulator n=1 Tax=Clostridium sp. TaxID=1506 RepID=UPI00284A44F3|nr:PucR family transcriptional regulator ligand-binding domain-containing protein [Clostridium sp.]MDR3593929.1 PucR family transcriptional regulator ligand-binding domain-containing protein [Clostridium sp.]
MSILVKDILKLKSLEEMKLVGGNIGLEKCIEWIYVSECLEDPLEGIKWLQGGEIVIITGVGIKSDISVLTKLIEGISEKNGAALIVNVGKYIKEIPEQAIEIADKLQIALFTLPWEVRLIEVSKEISNAIILARIEEKFMNDFLNNILFGQMDLGVNIKEKANYFGYNLHGKCCICIIEINGFKEFPKTKNLYDEMSISKIKLTLRKLVQDTLEKYSLKVPIINNDDEIIFLNRAEENSMNRLNKALKEIQEIIEKRLSGISVNVGIGNGYEDLNLMKESFNEAKMVIESLKCEGGNQVIKKYTDIGIYSLIFSVDNKKILENYCKQVIGPIIEKNKKSKEVSSIQILDMYLNENCNLTLAAEKLYLHRNTLTYRIKKIEQLLNCNLHNFEDCLRIKMALYISKTL